MDIKTPHFNFRLGNMTQTMTIFGSFYKSIEFVPRRSRRFTATLTADDETNRRRYSRSVESCRTDAGCCSWFLVRCRCYIFISHIIYEKWQDALQATETDHPIIVASTMQRIQILVNTVCHAGYLSVFQNAVILLLLLILLLLYNDVPTLLSGNRWNSLWTVRRTRSMYWRRASIQDCQASTSAWWRHCSETVFPR